MQSILMNELFNSFDSKIFNMAVQVVVMAAIGLYLKEISSRIVDFMKLKMSDLGRGTRIEILGKSGHIESISFKEVEINLGDDKLLLIPVEKFVKSEKIIYMRK